MLKTYRNPKGINCKVKPNLWGEHYAATAGAAKVKGVIDRWKDNTKDALMIRWDGYQKCQHTPDPADRPQHRRTRS